MAGSRGKPGSEAVVIGASMAGLLAARVLADHVGQVTLVERDTFPAPGEHRKGIPQGRHTHVLLERGRQVMEGLLPGLTDELAQRGAVAIRDASLNIRWFHGGVCHRPGASGIAGVGVSRPTLESVVRSRVLALPNVRAVEGCAVSGLTATGDHRRVTGVRVVDRHGERPERTMPADLVVDASGRGSRTPAWLEALGYARPPEAEVRIGMGYVTCYFRRRPDHLPGLDGVVLLATPPDRRLAVLLAQDGDRWVVTLGGYLGDHAPTDFEGFVDAARGLAAPHVYEVIRDAEPLGEPVAYTFPANRRRRYDELDRFPDGYLVIGDALCSFNPIYGQGMTVAALEARALGECLASRREPLARAFFAEASTIVDVPWSTAVGSDLSFPEVVGPRTPFTRFLNWYMEQLHRVARADAQVSIAFLKVINMVAPPSSILHPRIVWRVMKGRLWPAPREAPTGGSRDVAQAEPVAAHR